MSTPTEKAHQFLRSEDGPTATEYAILLALIIVVALISIRAFGVGLDGTLKAVSDAMFG